MQRPNLSPIFVAAIAGLILVVAGLVALAIPPSEGLAPAPSGSTLPIDPSPSASSLAAIDPAACALVKQPGPADEVPQAGGDAMDVADLGNGRWRLCLSAPVPLVLEGSAWCTWLDDRSTVREVTGLPIDDGSQERVDGGVTLDHAGVYLGLTSTAGEVASFVGGPDRQRIDPATDGRSGAAAFRLAAVIDPENPAAVRAPDRLGTIRWACGEPPPPRPGRSTGRVDLRLDEPVGGAWRVAGTCSWFTTPTGRWLQRVETYPPAIQRAGARLAISIDPNRERPDEAQITLWVDPGTEGDFYQASEGTIVVRQARDGGSGLVRFRHLMVDPSSGVRISADVTDVSGVLSWTCPPPMAPGPSAPIEAAGEQLERHVAHATVHLDPAVVDAFSGDLTCFVDRSDAAAGAHVADLRGSIVVGGSRLEIQAADSGSILLAVIGPDGQPAGEYTGQISEAADDAGRTPLLLIADPIFFQPTDPHYVPLGGPSGPRSLRIEIDYTCDLRTKAP